MCVSGRHKAFGLDTSTTSLAGAAGNFKHGQNNIAAFHQYQRVKAVDTPTQHVISILSGGIYKKILTCT